MAGDEVIAHRKQAHGLKAVLLCPRQHLQSHISSKSAPLHIRTDTETHGRAIPRRRPQIGLFERVTAVHGYCGDELALMDKYKKRAGSDVFIDKGVARIVFVPAGHGRCRRKPVKLQHGGSVRCEGLCGRFNASVINKTQKVIDYLQDQMKYQVTAVCFGSRGGELLKRKYPDLPMHIIGQKANKNTALFQEAEKVALTLVDMFNRDLFDECTVVYSEFESAAVQHIKVEQIIPLQTFQHEDKWEFLNQSEDPNYVKRDVLGQKKLRPANALFFTAIGGKKIRSPLGSIDADALLKESTRLPDAYDYEESDLKILDYVLPQFVEEHVYKVLLNTMASESASRMIAMESASKNATDMVKKINKKYHRKRQELVTKDLTEVVAGSVT